MAMPRGTGFLPVQTGREKIESVMLSAAKHLLYLNESKSTQIKQILRCHENGR